MRKTKEMKENERERRGGTSRFRSRQDWIVVVVVYDNAKFDLLLHDEFVYESKLIMSPT